LQEFKSKIKRLLSDAVKRCDSDCIALSGGLDSSILASCLDNKKVRAFTVITKDFPSTDLVYAQLAAKITGLSLAVITVNIDDLLSAIEKTIKILKVFNPMEIRNNVVVYLVMESAMKDGYKSMMTGDGADELFAGYNFFKRLAKKDLEKDLERIWSVMHFPSLSIAKSLGMSLHTPFLDKGISEYAKKIPSDLKVKEEVGAKYGKWILRKAFEDILPPSIVWREKSAMQDGSGTNGLTLFLDNLIADSSFSEKSKLYIEKEKIRLLSKESLFYYEIYRKYYDIPFNLGKSETKCPYCNFDVNVDSHFCRMCGSYPI